MALEGWLGAVGVDGLVFRTFDLRGVSRRIVSTQAMSRAFLRRRAAAAGVAGDFTGHSRRGFITNAAKKKIPIESIKRLTGER